MTVDLVDHPLFDTDVLEEAQADLDGLASTYVTGLDGAEPEMERFLFGSLPVSVFDQLFAAADPDAAGGSLWLLHLSGYFGGRWLRGEIAAAQPDAPLVGFSTPPSEQSFNATMERAETALEAARGDDDNALIYAEASLFDAPPTEPGGDPVPGLADGFGYNQGYLLEILGAPPEGLATPEVYMVECAGLLTCRYTSPKLAVLQELKSVQDGLNGGDDRYTDLAAALTPIQDAAVPRGRAVWSGGLSVQGFPQRSYDQLLDVSSSFLETIQATALTMARATGEADVDAARTGAVAQAAMIVWLEGYTAGLINGDGDIELPAFG